MAKSYRLFTAMAALGCAVVANAGIVGHVQKNATVEDSKWETARATCPPEIVEGNVQMALTAGANGTGYWTDWGAEMWESDAVKAVESTECTFITSFKFQTGNDVSKNAADEYGNETYKQQGFELYLTGANEKTNWWQSGDDYIFKMCNIANSRLNSDPTNNPVFMINGDSAMTVSLSCNTAYQLAVVWDTAAKTLSYTITDIDAETEVASNSDIAIPEGANALPKEFYVAVNRNYGSFTSMALSVGKNVEGAVAVVPSYKVIQVIDDMRLLSFAFGEDEEMFYEAEDGALWDNDGDETTSGSFTYDEIDGGTARLYVVGDGEIKIWTVVEDSESEKVDVVVDRSIIKLPEPVVNITAVEDGFSKTYQVTVDNSEVLCNPDITFNYSIDGGEPITAQASGTKIVMDAAGTLKLQAVLTGYESSDEITVVNDIEYTKVKEIDFEHMTAEQLTDLGFEQLEVINSSKTSGEQNWTARLRMWNDIKAGEEWMRYFAPDNARCGTLAEELVDDEMQVVFTVEDGDVWPTVQPYQLPTMASALDSTAAMMFEPLLLSYSGNCTKDVPWQVKIGVGLIANATLVNDLPMGIRGIGENDFALIYRLTNYGENYPTGKTYASLDEAMADNHGTCNDVIKGNGNFSLYRIDNAITRIVIMAAKGGGNALREKAAVATDDACFTLGGVKLGTKPAAGLYVQNGKLKVVK